MPVRLCNHQHMPDKIEDSYYFSYPFEYIARNHGDDKYDIGYATMNISVVWNDSCLLYTSPSPRDRTRSRMPSSA